MKPKCNSGTSCTRIVLRETKFTWRIENFSLCNRKRMEYIESQVFPKLQDDKCQWRLNLYPYGCSSHNLANYSNTSNEVSAFLEFIPGKQKNTTANFTLSFEDKSGTTLGIREFKSIGFPLDASIILWQYSLILQKNQIINKLDDDILVIKCSVTWDTYINHTYSEEMVPIKINTHKNLSNDLNQLMIEDSFSKVTLLSNDGMKFFSRKTILAAHSPVFAYMIEQNIKEKQECIIKIEDSNSDILKTMLEFIYTGKLSEGKWEMAELLVIGDKYKIKDLIQLCQEELTNKITIENAGDLLLLANKHNFEILNEKVVEFITKNFKDVAETKVMKNLSSTQPTLYYVIKTLAQK